MLRTDRRRVAAISAATLVAAIALIGAGTPAGAGDKEKDKLKNPSKEKLKVDETLGNLAQVVQPAMHLEGIGLVMGLENTGSDPPPGEMRQRLLDQMRKARSWPASR